MEFDKILEAHECVVLVPYVIFLTNPDKAILKCPSMEAFMDLIGKQEKHYVIIYVTKCGSKYIAWNQHFAYSFDLV